MQVKSPLYRLKDLTVVYMITCRLSSCNTGVYNVCLLIILEMYIAVCIERKLKFFEPKDLYQGRGSQ